MSTPTLSEAARVCICGRCEREFRHSAGRGPKPKWCPECWASVRKPTTPQPCPICRKPFSQKPGKGAKRITCSPECKAESDKIGRLKYPCMCQHCGREFKGKTVDQPLCSAECRRAVGRGGIRRKIRSCVVCGKTFHPKYKPQVCCSVDCGRTHRFAKLPLRECGRCGAQYQSERLPMCGRCMQTMRDRVHCCKRRSRLQAGEDIDPYDVYERDSWTCGVCGEQVDKALSYPDPASASLDHITALAKGGRHVLANVQCAHLRCNLKKRTDTTPTLSPSLTATYGDN